MSNDDQKQFVTSMLIGLAGFLASHVFARIEKRGDKQVDQAAKFQEALGILKEKVRKLEEEVENLQKHRARRKHDE